MLMNKTFINKIFYQPFRCSDTEVRFPCNIPAGDRTLLSDYVENDIFISGRIIDVAQSLCTYFGSPLT